MVKEMIMKEEIVSLETAELLREKRYPQSEHKIDVSILHNCYKYLSVPPQSIVQKWLREYFNIHISIYRDACGYGYDICKADSGTNICSDEGRGYNDAGNWNKYEEALEEAIKDSLKRI